MEWKVGTSDGTCPYWHVVSFLLSRTTPRYFSATLPLRQRIHDEAKFGRPDSNLQLLCIAVLACWLGESTGVDVI